MHRITVASIIVAVLLACVFVTSPDAEWEITTTVDNSTDNVGWYTSIALDRRPGPHIAYYDSSNSLLKYVRWSRDRWATKIVDSATSSCSNSISIGVDDNDTIHISYQSTGAALGYARSSNNGTTWATEIVDLTASTGWANSLALD
ncbi:MAG: hypothetical protein GY869_19755, partial [Planctomycetes bacterium]|nr:hypothetical protein [Planctomycetota bacterium]